MRICIFAHLTCASAALFTPIESTTSEELNSTTTASTVHATALLISDLSLLLPPTSNPKLWQSHLNWSTHTADVQFITSSITANHLVDSASTAAQQLKDKKITEKKRDGVRNVLEGVVKGLMPLEKEQGEILLSLGGTMVRAVKELYCGEGDLGKEERVKKEVGKRRERSATERDEERGMVVPENDLVRETRQVLIRASGLFENAYASFLKIPKQNRLPKEEQKLLRRVSCSRVIYNE